MFRRFVLDATTYVATDETGIVGFVGIEADGHVSSTYVRGDRLHQGIGSALMRVPLDYAAAQQMTRLYAEASKFSLGLFQKFGFRLYDTEFVDFNGVAFSRYLVKFRRTEFSRAEGSAMSQSDEKVRITIFDTTLRDGGLTLTRKFTFSQKLQLALMLAALAVGVR